MNFFCKHQWEVKSKEILASACEQMNLREAGKSSLPAWVFKKKLVMVLACTKCGKLKIVIEENP